MVTNRSKQSLSLALYPKKQGGIRRPVFFINVCKRKSDLFCLIVYIFYKLLIINHLKTKLCIIKSIFRLRCFVQKCLYQSHLKNVFQIKGNDSLRG